MTNSVLFFQFIHGLYHCPFQQFGNANFQCGRCLAELSNYAHPEDDSDLRRCHEEPNMSYARKDHQ